MGGGDVSNDRTAELYSPPYLFKGPRPVISSVQDSIKASLSTRGGEGEGTGVVVKHGALRGGGGTLERPQTTILPVLQPHCTCS